MFLHTGGNLKRVILNLTLVSAVLLSSFALADGLQNKVVVIPLTGPKPIGDVQASNVLARKTFSNSDGVNQVGTMPNNGAMTINPGSLDQTIPEGYHNGSGTVTGDTDLQSNNIRNGVTIFSVTGNMLVNASGNATDGDVLSGKTYSNSDGSSTGTMPNIGTQNITPGTSVQSISQGYHDGNGEVAGEVNLKSINILRGKSLFGVSGTQGLPWGCRATDENGNYGWSYTECNSDCVTDIALITLCNPYCLSIESMTATLMGIPQLYCDGIGDNYPYR